MNVPRTFLNTTPATLRRLRDRYGYCLTHQAEPGCPPGDYATAVLAELGTALAGQGGAR